MSHSFDETASDEFIYFVRRMIGGSISSLLNEVIVRYVNISLAKVSSTEERVRVKR